MPINEVQILPFSILNLDQFLENGCKVPTVTVIVTCLLNVDN